MNKKLGYSKQYYNNRRLSVERSAQIIIPLLMSSFPIKSVVDLGCADGTWLSVFRSFGVGEILGVDGPWVEFEQLRISPTEFLVCDFSEHMPVINKKFDLACSIEVVEHIPDKSGKQLVKTLTELAPVVLLSAAVPYQGGVGHINEQRQSYWYRVFRDYGYECIDLIRPQLWNNTDVNVIYRQNMFVYVNNSIYSNLSLKDLRITKSAQLDIIHPDLFERRMYKIKQKNAKDNKRKQSVRYTANQLVKAIIKKFNH